MISSLVWKIVLRKINYDIIGYIDIYRYNLIWIKCNHINSIMFKHMKPSIVIGLNMIKCDHTTLVKMLPMIIDKIKVWQKPTLY
jgi:hypothetical protein